MPGMRADPSRAEVIAHRGASAFAPEHTYEAYDLALTQGADVLELDVRSTQDGELLVVHDATLVRTAGDVRRVATLARADVERLPPRVRPLSLAAVFERYGASVRLLVELKDPTPQWEGLVVDVVEQHGMADQVVLQVPGLPALRRLRLRAPRLALSSLHWRRPSSRALEAVARCATSVGVAHHAVDAGLVAAAHARGLAVSAWTVNSPATIHRVLSAGADGLITDVPDVAVAACAAPASVPQAA